MKNITIASLIFLFETAIGNVSPYFNNPLASAAYWGNSGTVRELLQKTSSPTEITYALEAAVTGLECPGQVDDLATSAVARPCSNGSESKEQLKMRLDIVTLLLARGADPNDESNGETTIFAKAKNKDLIGLLKAKGGRLSMGDQIRSAIDRMDVKAVEQLLASSTEKSFQGKASQNLVRYALQKSFDSDPQLNPNVILNLEMSKEPKYKIFFKLIETEKIPADFKAHSFYHQTPLPLPNYFASRGEIEIVEYLIDKKVALAQVGKSQDISTLWFDWRLGKHKHLLLKNKHYFTASRVQKLDQYVKSLASMPREVSHSIFYKPPTEQLEMLHFFQKMGWLNDWPDIADNYDSQAALQLPLPNSQFKIDQEVLSLIHQQVPEAHGFKSRHLRSAFKLRNHPLKHAYFEMLLKAGVDANKFSTDTECPVFVDVIQMNDLEAARLLLQHKTTANIKYEPRACGQNSLDPKSDLQLLSSLKMTAPMRQLLYK